jgi:hypothetical protein
MLQVALSMHARSLLKITAMLLLPLQVCKEPLEAWLGLIVTYARRSCTRSTLARISTCSLFSSTNTHSNLAYTFTRQ